MIYLSASLTLAGYAPRMNAVALAMDIPVFALGDA